MSVTLGRPKKLTFEQREINRKASAAKYKKVNRLKYNKQTNEYNARNREKIRERANKKNAAARLITNDPFYNGDNQPITDKQKQSLIRVSEIIFIFCKEKKTKGFNYLTISNKLVTNSWHRIPMILIGWKDIKKINENKMQKILLLMSSFEYLLELGISKDICSIIYSYTI